MRADWSDVKSILINRGLSAQYVIIGTNYWIKAIDGIFELECLLPTDTSNTDSLDFVNNFLPNANQPLNSQVTTQYEVNNKDLKLARMKADVDSGTSQAIASIKVPGTFGVDDGRYIAGGDAITADYDIDDFATIWAEDTDRNIAMMIALGQDPNATAPVEDSVVQGMGVIPSIGMAFPQYPIVKSYTDDEASSDNKGWYFWPVAMGNSIPPAGEVEIEPIAGYGHIASGLYIKICYQRSESKTTGSIRINLFWGKKE